MLTCFSQNLSWVFEEINGIWLSSFGKIFCLPTVREKDLHTQKQCPPPSAWGRNGPRNKETSNQILAGPLEEEGEKEGLCVQLPEVPSPWKKPIFHKTDELLNLHWLRSISQSSGRCAGHVFTLWHAKDALITVHQDLCSMRLMQKSLWFLSLRSMAKILMTFALT